MSNNETIVHTVDEGSCALVKATFSGEPSQNLRFDPCNTRICPRLIPTSTDRILNTNMLAYEFTSGFALSLSLIIAIGAQNVYVIQRGLQRSHVFAAALFCALSDAILITIGVGGFGQFLNTIHWLTPSLVIAGVVFLFIYGGLAAWRALTSQSHMHLNQKNGASLRAVLATCFALTWLNPHVYLDTVVLLGTVSTQYENRIVFASGAVLASFVFFFSLGYGARSLAPVLSKPIAWKIIDIFVAVVMWTLAVRLLTK